MRPIERRAPYASGASSATKSAWFSLRSLRAKLQLFALLLVGIPGAALGLLAVAGARGALERAIGRQLAQIAGATIDELAAATGEARATVVAWTYQDVMRDVSIGDLDKRLARFFQTVAEKDSAFHEIYAVSRGGTVVAASEARLLAAPAGIADAATPALRGEVVVRPLAARSAGGWMVEIAAPIPDPERPANVLGALVARYDWANAIGRVDRIRRGLLAHDLAVDVLVLDAAHAVVGESWRDDLPEAERGRLRAAASTLAPPGLARGFRESSDAAALVGWAYGARPDRLGVVVLEPIAHAFAPVRRLLRSLGVTLFAVLTLAFVIATLLARRMSRPLRELTAATEHVVHAGGPLAPVPIRSRDEIGTLAAAFNTMGDALARAQDDLLAAAKFAFVGEVAAGIAHEVRTPLGIMRSSAQLLVRKQPPDAQESRELAEMIVGEVDRVARVVDGLLELARPREPSPEPTGLAPLLQRALGFVEGQARERGVSVHGNFAPAPPAFCDPEQIYQVALNLIVNAIQVLPRGGHIVVRVLPRMGDRVGFEVEDDGPGIPREMQARVFAPFFSARPGGIGLGLALVQRTVHAHRGTVTVASEPGRGTRFRVELPVTKGGA